MLNDCIKSCAEICMKCIVHTALDIGGGGCKIYFKLKKLYSSVRQNFLSHIFSRSGLINTMCLEKGVKYHRLINGMFIILSDMKDHMLDNVPIDQQPLAHYTSDDMHCEKL